MDGDNHRSVSEQAAAQRSSAETPDRNQQGKRSGVVSTALYLLVITILLLGIFSSQIRRWWEQRQTATAYVESMTLQEGDIRLHDVNAFFSDGKLHLRIALDNDLPSSSVSRVNDKQFDVEWEVAVIVDGERVHATAWTGSPKPKLLAGSFPGSVGVNEAN